MYFNLNANRLQCQQFFCLFQSRQFRKQRNEQDQKPTDGRMGSRPGRSPPLQSERRKMGSRRRRELRRGLVQGARRFGTAPSRRTRHHRQILRPHPRN